MSDLAIGCHLAQRDAPHYLIDLVKERRCHATSPKHRTCYSGRRGSSSAAKPS
jgi:hypothetical protein